MTYFITATATPSVGRSRLAGTALPMRLRDLIAVATHLRDTFAERRARRRELSTMLNMTDLELDDLGITREDVRRVVMGSERAD